MFELTEDQTMIRDMVRRFARDVVRKQSRAWNNAGALPSDVFRQLFDLGMLAATVPDEEGGSGLDAQTFAIVLEELGREDASLAAVLASHDAALEAIPDQREELTAVGELTTLAVDGLVLGGERVSRVVADDGLRSMPEGTPFAGLGLEAAAIQKIDAAAAATATWRRYQAAVAVGVARGALEEALTYAQEREQFGKPIAHYQAIQFKLAEMATAVDAARLLVRADSPHALRFAARAACMVTDEAVQIHGGYGYVREYPVERYFRDARWFGLWT